jgi:hypothetical protein
MRAANICVLKRGRTRIEASCVHARLGNTTSVSMQELIMFEISAEIPPTRVAGGGLAETLNSHWLEGFNLETRLVVSISRPDSNGLDGFKGALTSLPWGVEKKRVEGRRGGKIAKQDRKLKKNKRK